MHLIVEFFCRVVLKHDKPTLFIDDVDTFLQTVEHGLVAAPRHFSINVNFCEEHCECVDAETRSLQEKSKVHAHHY